jgi:hypothetical protein
LDPDPEQIKENYGLMVYVVTYIGTGSMFTLPVPGSRTSVADPHHVDADPDPASHWDQIRIRILLVIFMQIRIMIPPFTLIRIRIRILASN